MADEAADDAEAQEPMQLAFEWQPTATAGHWRVIVIPLVILLHQVSGTQLETPGMSCYRKRERRQERTLLAVSSTPGPCTDSYAAKMVSWSDTASLLRLGRVDHHEIVAVRHLHLRQRLRIHHVLGPDDAVEVQEIRRHGVDLLVGQ